MPEGAINQVTPAEGLYFESFSVTMVGVDFRAPAANIEPQCRFAKAVNEGGWLYSDAEIIDFQTVECPSPLTSEPQPNNGPGRFSQVEVSFNKQNWINNPDLTLNFQPTPICYTCNNGTSNNAWAVSSTLTWLQVIVPLAIVGLTQLAIYT